MTTGTHPARGREVPVAPPSLDHSCTNACSLLYINYYWIINCRIILWFYYGIRAYLWEFLTLKFQKNNKQSQEKEVLTKTFVIEIEAPILLPSLQNGNNKPINRGMVKVWWFLVYSLEKENPNENWNWRLIGISISQRKRTSQSWKTMQQC